MSRFKTILAASRSLSLSRTKFASVVNSLDLVAVTGSGQRALCTTCLLNKAEDRRAMMASLPKKDEGTQGDKSADIDASHLTRSMFPDEDTPNLLFDGVRFQDLPICHIKCSLNNTILALTDRTGKPVAMKSGGTEGYKNARKGTTVAAQAAALSFSSVAELQAIKNIRVIVKGLGPGRLASIKGLQMGGLNVVSITDRTPAPEKCPRPRKAKRL
ncbi:28S ribosomal protein S11, mitochondrial-like [Ixodes scapularis]|uniref:28S ribosomal protein S11, mitochondrial-like n=1 Tax=Ixodes scapularis TaxID=6945 RepID=UPI001A9D148C|nr:28S ribosomal protein S11, mitochondrial-like [Ixodes scapularis]